MCISSTELSDSSFFLSSISCFLLDIRARYNCDARCTYNLIRLYQTCLSIHENKDIFIDVMYTYAQPSEYTNLLTDFFFSSKNNIRGRNNH